MTRMRASLVKGDTLAEVAMELELGEYLRLGSGERKSGGHRRTSILADAFEAIVGAILLDSDVDKCRQCVLVWFDSRLQQLSLGARLRKTLKLGYRSIFRGEIIPCPFMIYLAFRGKVTHNSFRWFVAQAALRCRLKGNGSSRRKAEQNAAAVALERLSQK